MKRFLILLPFFGGACAALLGNQAPEPAPKLDAWPSPVRSATIDPVLPEFAKRFADKYPDSKIVKIQSTQDDWTYDRNDLGILTMRDAKLDLAVEKDGQCGFIQFYAIEQHLGGDKFAPVSLGSSSLTNEYLERPAMIDCKLVEPAQASR